MSNHIIVKCKYCAVVISQCRCSSKDKQTVFSVCNICKEIKITDSDPKPTLRPTPTPPGRGYE